jgi:uncharacterized membrane protein YgdD (TMEM256/DUF423 family)
MEIRYIVLFAALNGFIATGASALGSHLLASRLGMGAPLFAQSATFQFFHALAMLGAAFVASKSQNTLAGKAAVAFLLGIMLFCGTLYVRALMGPGSLGPLHWLTPLGGLSMMAGWVMLAVAGFRIGKR